MGGLLLRLVVAGLVGCLSPGVAGGEAQDSSWQVEDAGREAFSRPRADLTEAERERFFRGRSLFNQSWVVAPAKDDRLDGLGPLYNRLACVSCHARNGRGLPPEGPGERMQSMLLRLSVPGPRGGSRPHPMYGEQFNEEAIPGVAPEGRARLRWVGFDRRLPDGTLVSLRRPVLSFTELGYGAMGPVRISPRVGQQVVGMGLLDAVPDATLEALAAEAKPDGVKGRVNRLGGAPPHAGRFGYKANMGSLRAQIAGAFLGDLGITSSLNPQENCMPAQAACRRAPNGGTPELDEAQLDEVEFYLAHLAVPIRRDVDAPQVRQGELLFAGAGCAACHRPALRTGDSPRFPRLAGLDIAPYSDLLIHDMGAGLSDGRPDFQASGREWRTPPLWGIGLTRMISERARYLHDGRARSLTEAILWHGGEAAAARRRFETLARQERAALVAFLESL